MQQAKTKVDTPPAQARQFSTLAELKRASRWLGEYAKSVTSQGGEDGIVEKALSVLPERDGWCVEFGAWDGRHDSNSFHLVDQLGYRVILIECDPERYARLCTDYPHKDRATFLKAFVGWGATDGLDHILSQKPIPRNFDFLSVDVDGNDYYILNAMAEYRPKLILVEYNFTMPNGVEFFQPADPRCQQGSSAAALIKLAKKKGYELIAVTKLNLLFVDRAYYELFGIPDNSLEVMRDEEPNYVFFGYDGTVFLEGRCSLEWHPGLRLSASKIQVLPRFLRSYQPSYTRFQRWLFVAYFLLTHPKEGCSRIVRYIGRRFQKGD
jgi:methyltransferase FkbM-like protein